MGADFGTVIPKAEQALKKLQKEISKNSATSDSTIFDWFNIQKKKFIYQLSWLGTKLKTLSTVFQLFSNVYGCFISGVSGITSHTETLSGGHGFGANISEQKQWKCLCPTILCILLNEF